MKKYALSLVAAASLFGCGGGSSSNTSSPTNGQPVLPVPTLSVFAGSIGGVGSIDGTGTAASFNGPLAVATDSAGNVYEVDNNDHDVRKITPAGVVTTLAGSAVISGSTDGNGTAARFGYLAGITTDSTGNIYVSDTSNGTIRKITSAGVVSTFAGTAGVTGSANGTGAAASFNAPTGLATDSAGNIYVADSDNQIIRKITPAGVVSTLAGTVGTGGLTDGPATAATLLYPTLLATDSAGNVYVGEQSNNIREISSTGTVSTLSGSTGAFGSGRELGDVAAPRGIAVDNAGNVYASAIGLGTIVKISQGVVTTYAGTYGSFGHVDGAAANAKFNSPLGIAIDSNNSVYVADNGNNVIRKITSAGIVSTLAGSTDVVGSANGTGTAASFGTPYGAATDSAGNVYVADTSNSTIRKITPTGVVSTLAGTPGVTGSADGSGAAAQFFFPLGVATDGSGNVYVADGSNTIRKITAAGAVSTLAGSASPGANVGVDGTGSAAHFSSPKGLVVDSTGNVYVADTYDYTIRKVTPAGVVTTIAGVTGTSGSVDGTGTAAKFSQPSALTIDSAGNLYVTDDNSNAPLSGGAIRKITPAGVVTTLAGTTNVGGHADGTGAAASFNGPNGIAIDINGNLYVADSGNNTIRKVTPAGVVTTLVGVYGQIGYVGGTLPGSLAAPNGIAISGTSLYITTEDGVALVSNLP